MIEELIWLIFNDIKEIILAIDRQDVLRSCFWLLWGIIVFSPLKDVDRRDHLAAAVYVLFCMGAGVALVFAIPQEFLPQVSLGRTFVIIIVMGVIAALRWYYKNRVKQVLTFKVKQLEVGKEK